MLSNQNPTENEGFQQKPRDPEPDQSGLSQHTDRKLARGPVPAAEHVLHMLGSVCQFTLIKVTQNQPAHLAAPEGPKYAAYQLSRERGLPHRSNRAVQLVFYGVLHHTPSISKRIKNPPQITKPKTVAVGTPPGLL